MRNAKRRRAIVASGPERRRRRRRRLAVLSTLAALLLPSGVVDGGGSSPLFADAAFVVTGGRRRTAAAAPPLARKAEDAIRAVGDAGGGGGGGAVREKPPDVVVATEAAEEEKETEEKLSNDELKARLLELVPRMTGTEEERRRVEDTVNALEDGHEPIRTLDFWNWASEGEWRLFFSTNMRPPSRKLRLRELVQRIEPNGVEGTLVNEATWDLAEDGTTFTSSGTFSVTRSYDLVRGTTRLSIDADPDDDLRPPVLRPATGSTVPSDVPTLVGLLHRAMSNELFDPTGCAFDTTYLDGELRIVRYAGEKNEGVRNVFVRRNAIRKIDPTAAAA